MTIVDLVSEFEVLYEIGSLGLPGFEDDEIRKLLDIEQYKLINQRFQGNDIYHTKFPDTQKRIDDLLSLLILTDLDLNQTGNVNEYLVQLPADYLHIYEVRVKNTNGVYNVAEQVSIKAAMRFSDSLRNTGPVVHSPKFNFISDSSGNKLLRIFYYDATETTIQTTSGCQIMYIKLPTDLTSVADGTTLDDFNIDVYHEIVRATVDTAISIVTPQKAQVSQSQLNKTE